MTQIELETSLFSSCHGVCIVSPRISRHINYFSDLLCFRYVVFVAGAAKITIPNSTQEVFVQAGKNGLVFAADTAALSTGGHVSIFTKETVLMQVPTAGGIVPPHIVLYRGPCRGNEMID